MSWLDSVINAVSMSLGGLWEETVNDGGGWHAVVHGVVESQMRLSD